jgi:SAM-dependent methyltransferase
MTGEMIQLAKENAERMKTENVEFRLGEIENLPLEDEMVDVIISNCVINLSPDKDKVFSEAFRVLKPGGRLLISDIVTHGELPSEIRENLEMWAACVAGALDEKDYLQKIRNAGFKEVEVIAKNDFMGMVSSIKVRAYKP